MAQTKQSQKYGIWCIETIPEVLEPGKTPATRGSRHRGLDFEPSAKQPRQGWMAYESGNIHGPFPEDRAHDFAVHINHYEQENVVVSHQVV